MSMSANLHGLKSVEAVESEGFSWLRMESKYGSHISVFMPYATAVAMADAFNRAKAHEGDAACGGDLA